MSRRRDKDEDNGATNKYANLDKTSVLQEAKYCSYTPVNPKKCVLILTKALYLLNQGENLTTKEATDLFFATTKLFQFKELLLRRLVYLCIKELSPSAQDVIIVTSSLTKDMTGNENLYRAAAIRTLCCITDSSMLQAIDRYMKQAIVDKNSAVSSAALVSSLHLSASAPDLVRRWANEAWEAMACESGLVSYHALALVASIRRNDRLSTVKLIQKMILGRTITLSPYTVCLLLRYAAKLADEDPENSEPYMDFIIFSLSHRSEMVVYEAAHAIINMKVPVKAENLAQAVTMLQMFCCSSKATLRLAGVRALATLTTKHSTAVAVCVVDLENLISDPNRLVATLAVTTLLATGTESSIDRLLKQISNFISDISDEFKIVVVQAIRRLCSKFPLKHHSLATFLAGMLREQGGLQYKSAIADAIIALVEENPDAKESGLAHLCEFIEDCEHAPIAVRILHVLGREGPKTRQPSRYIRYIYNRAVLESGPVRAAAVSAVARFGAARPELLPNIMVLLARCQLDDDDEVRDRAVFYSAILDSGDTHLINDYVTSIQVPNPILLEKALADHLVNSPEEPFNFAIVPTLVHTVENKELPVELDICSKPVVSREEQYVDILKSIPDCDTFGSIFKSCDPIELTEPETEYRVTLHRHIFASYLVLQYECVNTLSDQLLESVNVCLEPPQEYKHVSNMSCDQLVYNVPGNVFHVLEFPSDPMDSLGSFGSMLEFVVRDCDPATGVPDSHEGYADTYRLEHFEMSCEDQIRMRSATRNDTTTWEATWERRAPSESSAEACDTFALPDTNVEEAAKAVCKHLSMPEEAISGDAVKEIRGDGLWRSGVPLLLRARLAAAQGTVTMQMTVRSPKEEIATVLLAAIR